MSKVGRSSGLRRGSALLMPLALGACGDDWRARPDAGPVPDADLGCEPVFGEPELGLQLVAELDRPVWLTAPPGDARLFVIAQQEGQERIIDPGDLLRDEPFLDVRDDTARGFEQGLLGLAFHPRYADNGRFHLSY